MRLRVLLVLLALCSVIAAPAQAAPGYEISIQPRDLTFSPGAGAVNGHWAVLWSTGATSAGVTTTDTVDRLSVEVDADQCEGAPHFEIALDGVTGLSQEVDGTGVYAVPLDWAPGYHRVTFRFLDDHRTAACDRNVRFRAVSLFSQSSNPGPYTFQQLKTRYVDIAPVTAGNATNQRAKLWNDGAMHFRLDSHGTTYLVVAIVVTPCGDRRPDVTVTVDGSEVVSGPARAGRTNLGLDGRLPDGPHDIVLRMSRDANIVGCDGNVALTSALFDGNVPAAAASAAERFEATLRPGDFTFSPGAASCDRDVLVRGEREVAVAGSFRDGVHDVVLRMSRDPNTATCDGNVAVVGAGFAGLLRP